MCDNRIDLLFIPKSDYVGKFVNFLLNKKLFSFQCKTTDTEGIF